MEIFPNGYIDYANNSDGSDIDANGLPTSGMSFDGRAKCTIETQSENRSGSGDDGTHPVGSYTIYVDCNRVPKTFYPKVVRIEHEDKGVLGTFPVQRCERYKITNTYQLWV